MPELFRKILILMVISAAALVLPRAATAADVTIDAVSHRIENGVYLVDANITFYFSADMSEALRSGIPLFFDFDFKISRERRYLWDATLYRLGRRYKLERHALANRYILTDLITSERRSYSSFEEALVGLGRLRGVPLGGQSQFERDGTYHAKLRVSLDIESLPAPLRPIAYVSPSWRMGSKWHSWQLKSADQN